MDRGNVSSGAYHCGVGDRDGVWVVAGINGKREINNQSKQVDLSGYTGRKGSQFGDYGS